APRRARARHPRSDGQVSAEEVAMGPHFTRVRRKPLAIVVAAALVAPADRSAVVRARAPVATAGDTAGIDGGWPRAYTTATGALLIVYQPQTARWGGRAHPRSCRTRP